MTAPVHTVPLTGWGRHPIIEAPLRVGENLEKITEGSGLSRGLGRSYGDAALPPVGAQAPTTRTTVADRMLSFDPSTGVLRAEAGLSLRGLMHTFLPRGWFTPVSTGTQYVTLGGMVASDVHGKNHHVHGTFGNFVRSLRMRTGAGEVVEASRDSHPELFHATLGGMGLTGHILEVEVALERLPSPWIYEETERYPNLEAIFEPLIGASETWPMTACWVDTSATGKDLGRGILYRGRWATPREAPPHPPKPRMAATVPDLFPSGVMNPTTVRWLNALFYRVHGAAPKSHVANPEVFFYQLDTLTQWNRGYGKGGFTQYQCVMPRDVSLYRRLLEIFQEMGGCSFVTVFKDCGAQGSGLLSFPKPGISMALDIAITPDTPALIQALNAFVIENGGRIYLAKDTFTSAEDFRQMYPRLEEFLATRERYDPNRTIRSAQSTRLMGW